MLITPPVIKVPSRPKPGSKVPGENRQDHSLRDEQVKSPVNEPKLPRPDNTGARRFSRTSQAGGERVLYLPHG